MMDSKQKESIDHLMYHMMKNNYKELCDKLKVQILEKLMEIAKHRGGITFTELQLIKTGIDGLRKKEREVETQAIVSVIDNLISRGDEGLTSNNEKTELE